MNRQSLKAITSLLGKIEQTIVNGDHTNTTTMKYFALLSRYYYYGGTVSVESRLSKSGILNTSNFSTHRAKQSYIDIAKLYTFGGQLKLRVSKALSDSKADLFGIGTDNIDKVVNKIRKFTISNGVDLRYNKNTNVLCALNIETSQSISRKLDNWNNCNELENLIVNRVIEVYGHDYKYLEHNYYEYVRQMCV